MVYSFLPAQLGVRNQRQATSLHMKAYSCFSPYSLIVKSVSQFLIFPFGCSSIPLKRIWKNSYLLNILLFSFCSDSPYALFYSFQHPFLLSFMQDRGTTQHEKLNIRYAQNIPKIFSIYYQKNKIQMILDIPEGKRKIMFSH